MKKKYKAMVILALGAGIITPIFAGCSKNQVENAEETLNNVVLTTLNENDFVRSQTDAQFDSFQYLFSQALSDQSVELSGLAKYNTTSQGYICLQYSISDVKLNENNNQAILLKELTSAIQSGEISKFTLTEVKDVQKLNNCVAKFVDSSVEGYDFNEGQVLSVKDIQFNDEEKQVSFNMINHAEYLKIEKTLTMIPVYNGVSFTFIQMTHNIPYYKTIVSDNSITITVESELYEDLKYDSSLILETFIEYTSNEQTDKYYVKENASTQIDRKGTENAKKSAIEDDKEL